MKSLGVIACLTLALVGSTGGQEAAPGPDGPARAAGRRTLAVYDAGGSADLGDTAVALPADGWKRIEPGTAPAGDAVLINSAVAVVVGKDGGGAALYARGADGWQRRARLVPVAAGKALRTGALKAAAAAGAGAAVEAALPGEAGGKIVFALKDPALPAVRVTAEKSADALRVAAPCRFAVLPDFFADDLMIDAAAIPADRADVPSDNFFLHMTGGGASIVAAVWEKNDRDVQVVLSGEGDRRTIESSEVFFGAGGAAWVAALEHKGIWYTRNFTRDEGIAGGALDWDVPFVAKWKGDFTRADGLVESRLFDYTRRMRWADRLEGQPGRLKAVLNSVNKQDVEKKDFVALAGPMVVYPTSRLEQTPRDQLCLDDLLRECLGSQPCAYILDVSSRTAANKGIFTCSYGATFGKIIPRELGRYDRVAAATLKDERAFVRLQNRDVLIFITHIQDRTNVYVEMLEQLLAYLDEQEKAHPELADFAGRMRKLATQQMFMYGGKWQDPIKRADGARRAVPLLARVYAALEVDTPERAADALAAVPVVPHTIGDPQDLRVAQLRLRTKQLRAMATMEMAVNPAAAETAKEIRKRTEAALRNPAGYEHPVTW